MSNSIHKTTLYRYFDRDGQLLYVGITGDNTKRQSQHRRNSFWFGEIASATFEHYDSRQEALDHESEAIRSENPKHNQTNGGTGIVISHSPKRHMVFLAGRPDGGHADDHKLFASLMRKGLAIYDGCYSTESQVVAAAMLFADFTRLTTNLQTCDLCKQAYSSDWFYLAVRQMKAANTLPDFGERK